MIEDTIEKMINERAVSYVKDMAEREERARGWIKIEDGCEMPAKGEFVNVCLADGRYTNSFIMSDGTWAFNIKPTKWKCVEKGKNNNESE